MVDQESWPVWTQSKDLNDWWAICWLFSCDIGLESLHLKLNNDRAQGHVSAHFKHKDHKGQMHVKCNLMCCKCCCRIGFRHDLHRWSRAYFMNSVTESTSEKYLRNEFTHVLNIWQTTELKPTWKRSKNILLPFEFSVPMTCILSSERNSVKISFFFCSCFALVLQFLAWQIRVIALLYKVPGFTGSFSEASDKWSCCIRAERIHLASDLAMRWTENKGQEDRNSMWYHSAGLENVYDFGFGSNILRYYRA